MSFLQTLAAAFKGGGERVPLARSFTSPWFFADAFPGGDRSTSYDYPRAVQQAYLDNPVAQRAVRLVAEGIGGAPLLPADPALAKLVASTSAGQSLLETLASHLLLHGNAYVQVMKDGRGRPVELFALRPERMQVIAGPDGWPTAFSYRVAEKALTIPLESEDASPNLIHIRHFHPADDHYGAGCLSAAYQAVAIHNAAGRWNRELLENAARPSGALVYDAGEGSGLTADQFERLKAELAQAFAGPANAGRPRATCRLSMTCSNLAAAISRPSACRHAGGRCGRTGLDEAGAGAWAWSDGVDAPLGEQSERYLVTLGDLAAPLAVWDLGEPRLVLPPETLATLPAGRINVRQQGNHALSEPLFLYALD